MFFRKLVTKIKRPDAWYALVGGALGALISFLVAAVMLEISSNRFFAIYFGILFLIVGLAVAKRVTLSDAWAQGGRLARLALGLFAVIMLLSSVSCFIVDQNALRLSVGQRIPFYLFLGVAVSFAVTFALMDVLNAAFVIIRSSTQMLLILFSSVTTGALFGLIFALLDVEDDLSSRHALIRDERVCAPVGMLVGAITGFATYKAGDLEHSRELRAPYVPDSPEDEGL
jgi:hypothetical protein